MTLFAILVFITMGAAYSGEDVDSSGAPLWNVHETLPDYASRLKLSPTRALDLGDGIKLDLVLIPAGKFVIGTPLPSPVDEAGFHQSIVVSAIVTAMSTPILLFALFPVLLRRKGRFQMSLRRTILVTFMAGAGLLGGLHWRNSQRNLSLARIEFAASTARYQRASDSEKPAHVVTISKPVYMGKFIVTQQQYEQVIGVNTPIKGTGIHVQRATWSEADGFCKILSEEIKQRVRLPTEAEWEYACRAGSATAYYSGDSESDLSQVGWYLANSSGAVRLVGQKQPNAFGLYDMHGNVWQWCEDWFGDYGNSESVDPRGPLQGTLRVIRGGSWLSTPNMCRSAYRSGRSPYEHTDYVGFRVVIDIASNMPAD